MAVADLKARIAELEIAQRRAEMIARINASLSRATDEQGILSAVAGLAEQTGVAGSALAYAKTDTSGHVIGAKLVAMQLQRQPLNLKEALPTDEFPLDTNPILGMALENPDEPLFVENVFTDPRMETGTTRDAFRYTGMTATVILWFRAAGRILGVMTFNWVNEQPFNEEVREVFKAIQPVAAAVIANRRLLLELEQTIEERTIALRESEERSVRAQEVGGIGIWELDLVSDSAYWSDIMFKIAGRDPSRGMPTIAEALSIVHPGDQEKVNAAIQQSA
ncbi:MAG: hypothetical protein OIN84_09645, partial [Candidatus Methanoperedens sp.]|nr:hypothetical protein [Candidatus Methanoperedens sp.]